jgi:putative colanic acid biosynthesis acetyltransferase WcaF
MQILKAEKSNSLKGGPSFSLSNRVYRTVWRLTWFFLARWTPPPFRAWRRLLLRLFGASMGRGSDVRSGARVWSPRNLVMNEYASLGDGVNCYNMARIELGRFVVISQRTHLCTGTHEIDEPTMQLYAQPIRIGDHAWVAAEAYVGPGVTIGDGAVLGARGVTARDLEPWSVYVGNPAEKIRSRPNIAAGRERGFGKLTTPLG